MVFGVCARSHGHRCCHSMLQLGKAFGSGTAKPSCAAMWYKFGLCLAISTVKLNNTVRCMRVCVRMCVCVCVCVRRTLCARWKLLLTQYTTVTCCVCDWFGVPVCVHETSNTGSFWKYFGVTADMFSMGALEYSLIQLDRVIFCCARWRLCSKWGSLWIIITVKRHFPLCLPFSLLSRFNSISPLSGSALATSVSNHSGFLCDAASGCTNFTAELGEKARIIQFSGYLL